MPLAAELLSRRLRAQCLFAPGPDSISDVVARLTALQAQDYTASLWSVGVRASGTSMVAVEQALERGEILRSWAMRGTWHLEAAADVRLLLTHLTPRVLAAAATREQREYGLDAKTLARCETVLAKQFDERTRLGRDELYASLAAAKISTEGQRGYHILWNVAQRGLLVCTGRIGRQPAFSLLDAVVPQTKVPAREEALAILAERYLRGHGPATVADFAWWAGLPVKEAKAAIATHESALEPLEIGGDTFWAHPAAAADWRSGSGARAGAAPISAHLLPSFDEYLLGYTDRTAMLPLAAAKRVQPGTNGMFLPVLLVNGQVAGTWRRTIKRGTVVVELAPFAALSKRTRSALVAAAQRYADFLEADLTVK
jgi:hypothetical protein